MWDFSIRLWDMDFPVRWECGPWTAGHGWLHIGSDGAIAAAYLAIPLAVLVYALRSGEVPLPPAVSWFCGMLFIAAWGHLIELSLFWYPWVRFSGVVKLITAMIAWTALFALFRLRPDLQQFPRLTALNDQLARENAERKRAEHVLRERNAELEQMNEDLETISRLTVGREERIIELKQQVNELLQSSGQAPRYPLRLKEGNVPGFGS